MNESDIKEFWNNNPCGDWQVGGLNQRRGNYEAFFSDYDRFRYKKEAHILRCLDNIDFKDKKVLEIGLGQGADSEQIIRRGAVWSGLDLTPESVARVQTRLTLRALPHETVKQGSALDIPFNDHSFDMVFSHGVLHHIPEVEVAQKEIHRVLKPGGELIAMFYARWSLNYQLAISIVRRLGLFALWASKHDAKGIQGQHLTNARAIGFNNYLRMENFIHKNTDGPLNPYSKVYDVKTIREDFKDFEVIKVYKQFMHAPPLKVGWLPLERTLGWHLWAHMRPR